MTKILDLPEGQEVAVIGTLYKEMKLKPSILDEYNKVPLAILSSSCLGTLPHIRDLDCCSILERGAV